MLVALLLGLAPAQNWTHQTLSGDELARCAGVAPVAGAFILQAGDYATVDLRAPSAFRDAAVWWHGELGQAWMHFSDASGLQSAPDPLLEDEHLSASEGGLAGDARVAALVHGYGEPSVGVHLTFFGPVSLADLTVLWIAPPEDDRAAEGFTVGYNKPPVYSRAFWGAAPPTCSYSYCTTTHVGIHHTASASDFNSTSLSQCAANVKATQTFHQVSKGWCDIAYNYLICKHGDIFEGRGGGDNVTGAHDGYNCGSMGVCLLGYFHTPVDNVPPAAMIDAIEALGAWKCSQQKIDPLGSSWYAGFGATLKNVYGHRDVSSTACPGDHVYNKLGAIRSDIASKLAGGGSPGLVVQDNDKAAFLGAWASGTSAAGKYGADYRWASTQATLDDIAFWLPVLPGAGNYEISVWWAAGTNRNPAAFIGIGQNGQYTWSVLDQRVNGGKWNVLGTRFCQAGNATAVAILGFGEPGAVTICDAVRFLPK